MIQRFAFALLLPFIFSPAFAEDPKSAAAPVSFDKTIRPLLLRHCQGCHQPAKMQGGLDVTSYQALRAGGDAGEGFIPGKPDESVLMEFIEGDKPRMPKGGMGIPFSKEQVALIKQWIAEGARDDTPAHRQVRLASPEKPPEYQHAPVIPSLVYSPDGSQLAVAGYHEVLIHQADGQKLLHRLIGVSPRIQSLAYSPDGRYLAAAGGSPGLFGELQIWDLQAQDQPRIRHSIPIGNDTIYGVSFSPDNSQVAIGCSDNSARVIRVQDGKTLLRVDHHQDWVLGSTFSVAEAIASATEGLEPGAEMRRREIRAVEGGKLHLVTVGRDRALKLTELDTGAFIDDLNKLLDTLRCMAKHPTLEQVACGGDDGIPRIYKIYRTKSRVANDEDFNLIRAFEKQPGVITALAFTADGTRLLVGSTPSQPVR
ncbi:MAG TPA: hypothetical protein PKD72_08865, partial [Gemmatales bacterium]|nr:hypothetical protein [Gemmatales bacterium]